MPSIIVTGASRGIGRGLAIALAADPDVRLLLSARRTPDLAAVVSDVQSLGGAAQGIPADLSSVAEAERLADEAAAAIPGGGATLVSNAGIWPSHLERTAAGYERAWILNAAAPVRLAERLIDHQVLRRILMIGAGLMVKGRFDAERTPVGADFSAIRTYCSTKLAGAVAMRDLAARHPAVDVAVVHPGVVRTGLGDRSGPLGVLLRLAKRRWEDPAVTAQRLVGLLALEQWSSSGEAAWFVEDRAEPWPAVCEDPTVREAVRRALVSA